MTENTSPAFSSKCQILADLWMNFRSDEEFADFIEYNDLGLPLAYAFSEELAKPTELAERYIDETYALLVEALGVSEIETYNSLAEMLDESESNK